MDDQCVGNASFWIYFDGKNKKIDNTDKSLFPGRSMEIVGLDLSEEEMDEIFKSVEKFDCLDSLADLLRNWFIDCWNKQNGGNI